MLGRLLTCAVAMGMATPACAGEESQPAAAGERASYTPDTLALLMLDERTTWGTPASPPKAEPGFTIGAGVIVSAAPPMPSDIASFDDMPATAASLPSAELAGQESPFAMPNTLPALTTARTERIQLPSPARDAIGDSRERLPRPTRLRRSPLDTMLVFKLDGEAESPSFRFGGGVASVLNVLPRQ